jgi:hypothetical protein
MHVGSIATRKSKPTTESVVLVPTSTHRSSSDTVDGIDMIENTENTTRCDL